MNAEAMLDAGTGILKQFIGEFVNRADSDESTVDLAKECMQMLRTAVPQAATAMFRCFLESLEDTQDIINVQGEVMRYKCTVDKEYETFFGKMTLARRGYQGKADGPFYYPLDEAWGMAGQYATAEVREAMTFSCAHVTPEETAAFLEKSAMFHPHATAIKHVVQAVGDVVEQHPKNGGNFRMLACAPAPALGLWISVMKNRSTPSLKRRTFLAAPSR